MIRGLLRVFLSSEPRRQLAFAKGVNIMISLYFPRVFFITIIFSTTTGDGHIFLIFILSIFVFEQLTRARKRENISFFHLVGIFFFMSSTTAESINSLLSNFYYFFRRISHTHISSSSSSTPALASLDITNSMPLRFY